MIYLFTGGARSGKSRLAESTANKISGQITVIATATADDDEMQQRIDRHQQERPDHWHLIEEPLHLAKRINSLSNKAPCLLIDCMTLWLSNWLHYDSVNWVKEKEKFIEALQQFEGDIIIVSNEVGSGIVPLGQLSRQFVDEAGWLNQSLAQVANHVTLVVAGLPLTLKEQNVL